MKKLISLLKATMIGQMNIFKYRSKSQSKLAKIFVPVFLILVIFIYVYNIANTLMIELHKINLEYILLTIFIFLTFLLTLFEGIYKSSNLIFNCYDDDLLLSLPIRRKAVLFVRLFRFYVFELLFNSIFLFPVVVVYVKYMGINFGFILITLIMLLTLPIIPIFLSAIVGFLVSKLASKFKYKNLTQTLITIIFLIGTLYISFNFNLILDNFVTKAININDIILKLYYPAGVYNKLILSFNIVTLLEYLLINLIIVIGLISILGKFYFKINSDLKNYNVNTGINKSNRIKVNKPIISLIKKEFNKFLSSPVFLINSSFGLVLFIIGCLLIVVKGDNIFVLLNNSDVEITSGLVLEYMPSILFAFMTFSSLMSSITCSMISLEKRSINVLKSLPVKTNRILLAKVFCAVLIVIPCLLVGDLLIFIKFNFSYLEIFLIIILAVILALVSELIGIIVNLKYPKLDVLNDTEAVKQSISSFIAVLIGLILSGLTIGLVVLLISNNYSNLMILLMGLIIYSIILVLLLGYLRKYGIKDFNKIVI